MARGLEGRESRPGAGKERGLMRAEGAPLKELAKSYNIGVATISRLRH